MNYTPLDISKQTFPGRLSAAHQEYTQFLNGYRALVASFADLSARHVLPDNTPLPLSQQSPTMKADEALTSQQFLYHAGLGTACSSYLRYAAPLR